MLIEFDILRSYFDDFNVIKVMRYLTVIFLSLFLFATISCKKLSELVQGPELTPLDQGFKTSAAIGYCASLANSAFTGQPLPNNVTFQKSTKAGYTSAGLLHVTVTSANPVPFNHDTGDIYIAGLWDADGGVISIVFADIDIFTSQYKFYGLYTVPVVVDPSTGKLTTIFAQQDIIIGQGSDTLLDLSLSKPKFDAELQRTNQTYPTDAFAAIKQNVWFIGIDQNNTPSNIYDDAFEINGGGQIVEATSNSGGVLYHAMIQTKFSYSQCSQNPTSGIAIIQNFQASGSSIDLGNITLEFHDACDGRAKIDLATGKYITSNGSSVALNWN